MTSHSSLKALHIVAGLRFGGEVEVEVYPINFGWRRRGRGGVEVW